MTSRQLSVPQGGRHRMHTRDARFVFLSCLSDAQQNSHHCSLRRRVRNQLDASVVLLEPRKLDAIASSE